MQIIKKWMDANRQKINSSKTEFIALGSYQRLKNIATSNLDVNGERVKRSGVVKYLGAFLDKNVNFKRHITQKCEMDMYNLLRLRNISHMFSKDSLTTLVLSLVISHLDYVNGILAGLPKCDISRMQRVQNIAAKLILKKGKYDSAKDCLHNYIGCQLKKELYIRSVY